jgi:hypothetical protein
MGPAVQPFGSGGVYRYEGGGDVSQERRRIWGKPQDGDPMRILIFEDEGCIDLAPQAFCLAQGHHMVGVSRSTREAIRLARTTKPDIALVLSLAGGSDDAFLLTQRLSKLGVFSLLLNCEADEGKPASVSLRWEKSELGGALARYQGKIRPDDDESDTS